MTLHVGAGTFQPVRVDNILEHHMHSEWCRVEAGLVERIHAARARGNRVVAVGTTVARSLETAARGGTLARLQTHVPAVTMPALVIAQRLYGDPARMEARAAEIAARNKVPHPGFVPGGAALQVLSAEAANG